MKTRTALKERCIANRYSTINRGHAVGAMEQLARFIAIVDPKQVCAGGFGKLDDRSSGEAATFEHISSFLEWKAKPKDEIMHGIKKMCPEAAIEYTHGCGHLGESISSLGRLLKIGHNLYGFTRNDNPFSDESLHQQCLDMAEIAVRSQQGGGKEPEPQGFDQFEDLWHYCWVTRGDLLSKVHMLAQAWCMSSQGTRNMDFIFHTQQQDFDNNMNDLLDVIDYLVFLFASG